MTIDTSSEGAAIPITVVPDTDPTAGSKHIRQAPLHEGDVFRASQLFQTKRLFKLTNGQPLRFIFDEHIFGTNVTVGKIDLPFVTPVIIELTLKENASTTKFCTLIHVVDGRVITAAKSGISHDPTTDLKLKRTIVTLGL